MWKIGGKRGEFHFLFRFNSYGKIILSSRILSYGQRYLV